MDLLPSGNTMFVRKAEMRLAEVSRDAGNAMLSRESRESVTEREESLVKSKRAEWSLCKRALRSEMLIHLMWREVQSSEVPSVTLLRFAALRMSVLGGAFASLRFLLRLVCCLCMSFHFCWITKRLSRWSFALLCLPPSSSKARKSVFRCEIIIPLELSFSFAVLASNICRCSTCVCETVAKVKINAAEGRT